MKFRIGQLIYHKKLRYRGVIVEADSTFQGTDEWYDEVARSRPPRDQPWYRVLVDEAEHETYVAERHLEEDRVSRPIRHPNIALFFDEFHGDHYECKRLIN